MPGSPITRERKDAPPLQRGQCLVDGRKLSGAPDELLGRWGNHDASARA